MSILSASARRISQAANNSSNCQLQWPVSVTSRQGSISSMGRRRALDLYGTKDVLFSHENVKKESKARAKADGITISG